jgi:hypothetical protein
MMRRGATLGGMDRGASNSLGAGGGGGSAIATAESFRKAGQWYCAGRHFGAVPGGLAPASMGFQFQWTIYAVPEPFPVAGTIDKLATIKAGSPNAASKVRIGIAEDTPATRMPGAQLFEWEMAAAAGFDGNQIREATPAPALHVDAGTLLWFLAQSGTTVASGSQSLNLAKTGMRSLLGETAAVNNEGYVGWVKQAIQFTDITDFSTVYTDWDLLTAAPSAEDGLSNCSVVPAVLFQFTPD